MKKTITLKSTEPTHKAETRQGLPGNDSSYEPGLEPDEQVISNILNYSRALNVKRSALLGHISNLSN